MSTPFPPVVRETANDLLKRRFSGIWWNSITAAVVIHFLLFAFFPRMTAADMSRDSEPTKIIVPPPIPIPPPPEKLARPMAPVPTPRVPDDITVPLPIRDERSLPPLPPPKIIDEGKNSERWIPRTIEPRLRNTEEIQRALTRLYPSTLRDAGIGGQTVIWFYIDEKGNVARTEVKQPSQHPAFDAAALRVADLMKFSPAYNRDKPVAVWVSLPILFSARTP
jgi:protein TonB